MLQLLIIATAIGTASEPLPSLTLTHDDTIIDRSCEITVPTRAVIPDKNDNGVIHITKDGITVRFAAGAELRGAPPRTPWDTLEGIGIRLVGCKDVTIRNARVHGYKCGLVATDADGLQLLSGDFSDNYRQRLKSTPAAEDGTDWLFPHHNDQTKWRDQYGAAVCIENSKNVVIESIRARRGQNGIILDRVTGAKVFDNDCSFLSGWGLAMWRSSENLISRNAFDFCVRGHVEGVYNRGQDSAGILCFEQCNDNVFAENSATHCGDGFFGFAGRDAIGEVWMEEERERLRKEPGKTDVGDLIQVPPDVAQRLSALGCNRNLLIGNDFSYASAHGIELTFSEENRLVRNRLVENAICGIWSGYSSKSLIAENHIEGNGGMAYGLERGGINIEHGSHNLILKNMFRNNKCAVHLWWDDDAGLLKLPGVSGGEVDVTGNIIAGNTFECDSNHPFGTLGTNDSLVILQIRDSSGSHATNNYYFDNSSNVTVPQAREFAISGVPAPISVGVIPAVEILTPTILGDSSPVGNRTAFRGRSQIILDEWGPWNHESPMIRKTQSSSGAQLYELFGFSAVPEVTVLDGAVTSKIVPGVEHEPHRLRLLAPDGVTPFKVRVHNSELSKELSGSLIKVHWNVTFFSWETDPRTDLEHWRTLTNQPNAIHRTIDALDFSYVYGGPQDLSFSPQIPKTGPGSDHFGMIAHASLNLPQGNWRFRTLSDDGIRVVVNGRNVIENWTWHGPTEDSGTFFQTEDGEVEIEVEHFEIDGYSVLSLEIEPAR